VGPLRDADAAVRTFGKLRAALPARMRPGTDVARAALAERLRHAQQQAEDSRSMHKLARALRRQERRVAGWTPDGDGWKSVGPGFALGYQRARKAMHRAYRKPSGETFHAWRRAVKAHRFQVRFACAWLPAELNARAAELAILAECLGDEHDLTMLRRTLRANRFWFGEEGETYYEVLRRIDRRRREKRTQAQPLGERLFAEPPRALVGRIRRGFRDFRRARAAAA
jgi:CHAD domain-containing protein